MKTSGTLRQLERRLRILGSRRRLGIIMELKQRPVVAVRDLASAIGLSVFATSQHLRVLRSAGIVEDTPEGRYVFYRLSRIDDEPTNTVLKML